MSHLDSKSSDGRRYQKPVFRSPDKTDQGETLRFNVMERVKKWLQSKFKTAVQNPPNPDEVAAARRASAEADVNSGLLEHPLLGKSPQFNGSHDPNTFPLPHTSKEYAEKLAQLQNEKKLEARLEANPDLNRTPRFLPK